ncbi:MAG TPA: hypothetical protein VMZ50_07660 [Phycisphaerae bacterium]|nr:hypothetical protein [Phycisphaerae bacterium]
MLAATWDLKRVVIFSLPILLLLAGVVVWLFMRKTIRARFRVGKQLHDDPDINEWLIAFSWSRKILYFPMIIASFSACIAMAIIRNPDSTGAKIVGGIWLAIFVLNFLVDEYEMSVKVLLILVLCLAVAGLWLTFMDWLGGVLRFFGRLSLRMNWMGYLLIGVLFSIAVFISWLRGLFYYVAITPNYLNIQVGPTETGEQISREEYCTRIDTGDFLERLQGFGRIVITFSDQRRQPILLLVGRVGKKAARLESIRGKIALDRHQPGREGTTETVI